MKCKYAPRFTISPQNQVKRTLKQKFLDEGIQDVSTSISIVRDLIERYHDDDDGDESDKHI